MNTYEITIAGLKRHLPICPVDKNISIAAFVMFGDVEMTCACAEALLKAVPEFDYILVPEAKGIPLAYEMSRQSGRKYFVARKTPKVYMVEPVIAQLKSITTYQVQNLILDKAECDCMRGKRVLIIDDVISTGETLAAIESMIASQGAIIAGKAAVLAEGDAAARNDIVYLEKLPLFSAKKSG